MVLITTIFVFAEPLRLALHIHGLNQPQIKNIKKKKKLLKVLKEQNLNLASTMATVYTALHEESREDLKCGRICWVPRWY